jgi:hypothetical protein
LSNPQIPADPAAILTALRGEDQSRSLVVGRPWDVDDRLWKLIEPNRIDWSRAAMDGSDIDAKKGAPEPALPWSTGPSPAPNTACSATATATAPRSTC